MLGLDYLFCSKQKSRKMTKICSKSADYYEVRIYIGSRHRYNGPEFSEDNLVSEISDFQIRLYKLITGFDSSGPVRITKTRFVFGDYSENGWEIGLINYPRNSHSTNDVFEFASALAKHLLVKFDQNRISIICTGNFKNQIVMFYADDAEESHK